jgi:hypothetical protein
MGGAYVNFLGTGESQDRVRATDRGHYDRLAEVKRSYDPHNLFHANQNIEPAPPHRPSRRARNSGGKPCREGYSLHAPHDDPDAPGAARHR